MRHCFLYLLLFFTIVSVAQIDEDANLERKFVKKASEIKAPVDLYKIITLDNDTTFVDTTLTIQREYKFNYLRKDTFGLLQFLNEGQTYNTLHFGLKHFNPYPEFGFAAKHFAYLDVKDIHYYNVPTPYSDLYFKSVMEQGQNLDAFISANTSKNLNFSVGYKGLRSLGKYQHQLSSTGNFRFITSYNTTNKRYQLKAHVTAQDILNQENGGIATLSEFEEGENIYKERARLETYFTDANSLLKGNRFFVDHAFRFTKTNPNGIVLRHQFNFENKFFEFSMTANERFGDSYATFVNNKTRYNRMYNKVGVAYSSARLGDFQFFVDDFKYNYFYYRTVTLADLSVVPNKNNDRINTWGAQYNYQKNKWKASFLVSNSLSDQSLANIEANIRFALNEKNTFKLKYQNMNKLPDLNYVLYQSDYTEYNWYNNFKNEKINAFEVEAKTQWFEASFQYSVLKDHLFFANENPVYNAEGIAEQLLVKPYQYDQTLNYMSVKAAKEFKFWRMGFDATLLYQRVDQSAAVLNVPEFTTRNTLYYSDYFFKKALFLQTGVTLNYFTKYYANDYNPLLGEFYIQNQKEIGNFPMLDFFINAKVRTFRMFLKAEHFNSSFTGYNYYTAPNYPYRDFMVRFGVIWNFFS